jgi:hypothetical protein
MKLGRTMHLSARALEILRAATIDGQGRLRLAGPPESAAMRKEITTALTALGWVWVRSGHYFEPKPDPVAALAAAIETGEVEL